VCKFYPTPGCRNGAECPFVHTELGADELGWDENIMVKQINGSGHINGNGMSNGNGHAVHIEDEDSEDDVIFEPMRSASAQSPGGLSMVRCLFHLICRLLIFSQLLSGLALSGHSQAMHANGN
jgi:hypothetical protein